MPERTHLQAALALADPWRNDWLWSLPIIVLSVLAHCFGLLTIRARILLPLSRAIGEKSARTSFAWLIAAAVVLAITALHALEAGVWAFVYVALSALPDWRSAMLYSLSAITSYGHAALYLDRPWQMMGALEALNGMMLFGLTPAALFAVLQSYVQWTIPRASPASHEAAPS